MDSESLLTQLRSHASKLGVFGKVYGYEPKTSPIVGEVRLACGFWVQRIRPWMASSGLSVTSARVEATARVYGLAQSEPAEAIEPAMMHAVDLLMTAYNGDFDLAGAGTIWLADLTAEAGYIRYDDGSVTLRMFTINIPIKVDDAWTQTA